MSFRYVPTISFAVSFTGCVKIEFLILFCTNSLFSSFNGTIYLIYKEVFDGINNTPATADLMSFKVLIIEGIPLATLQTMVDVKDVAAVS